MFPVEKHECRFLTQVTKNARSRSDKIYGYYFTSGWHTRVHTHPPINGNYTNVRTHSLSYQFLAQTKEQGFMINWLYYNPLHLQRVSKRKRRLLSDAVHSVPIQYLAMYLKTRSENSAECFQIPNFKFQIYFTCQSPPSSLITHHSSLITHRQT